MTDRFLSPNPSNPPKNHSEENRFYVTIYAPHYKKKLSSSNPSTRMICWFKSETDAYQRLKIELQYDYCPLHQAWALLFSIVNVDGVLMEVVPAKDPETGLPGGWALLKTDKSRAEAAKQAVLLHNAGWA